MEGTGAQDERSGRSRLAPAVGHRPTVSRLGPAVAALAVVLVASRIGVRYNITVGTLAGLALAPVWISALRSFRGARPLVASLVVLAPMGLLLTAVAASSHSTSTSLALLVTAPLINFIVGLGVLLWARTQLTTATTCLWFAVGAFVSSSDSSRSAENLWRFGFGLPATLLLLAWAWRRGSRTLEVLLALVLGVISATQGGRSLSAQLLFAAVLTGWYALPRPKARASRGWRVVALVTALSVVGYQAGQAALLDGYFGAAAQQRTEAQLATSSSLLLGARPELGATGALIRERPIGFGSGTRPNGHDVVTAKTGMATLGYQPDNNYVERYMFGTSYELHSIVGDLWARYGLAGLATALAIGALLVAGLARQMANRVPRALVAFLVARSLWSLFFGPFYTDSAILMLALAVILERAAAASTRTHRRFPPAA